MQNNYVIMKTDLGKHAKHIYTHTHTQHTNKNLPIKQAGLIVPLQDLQTCKNQFTRSTSHHWLNTQYHLLCATPCSKLCVCTFVLAFFLEGAPSLVGPEFCPCGHVVTCIQ